MQGRRAQWGHVFPPPQPCVLQRGRVRAVLFTMLRPQGRDQFELPRPCLHYGGAAADRVRRG